VNIKDRVGSNAKAGRSLFRRVRLGKSGRQFSRWPGSMPGECQRILSGELLKEPRTK
jgi:hypothetical protein